MANPTDSEKKNPRSTKYGTTSLTQSISQTVLVKKSPKEQKAYLIAGLERQAETIKQTSNEEVAQMLAVVAATIGSELPHVSVLAKYIQLLAKYPGDLVEYAGISVLEKHKWNNFPRVAEFIEPIKEEYTDRLKIYRQSQNFYKLITEETPPALTVADTPRSGRGPRRLGKSLPDIKRIKK